MTKCSVMATVVSSQNPNDTGRYAAVCQTHNWTFFDGQITSSDSVCPIGQIEDAVDAGVAKILEALKVKE